MRCLFIIQGEGRGHLTQALALRQLLRQAGHEVVSALVGARDRQALPAFFRAAIGPITAIASPHFVTDAARRSVRMPASLGQSLRQTKALRQSLNTIRNRLQRDRPDVVVNFFEPMAGLYWGWHHPAVPMVAIAHQYMFDHPAYQFPGGQPLRRWSTRAFARLTAWGATKRLALSLYPAPDRPHEALHVLPPLLRSRVFDRPKRPAAPFFLLYVLNSGYAADIIRWHERHPAVRLHCFWDRPGAAPVTHHDETLTFHQLDGEKFLSMMARAQGVAMTAGFESVAEAMVLGKPVQVVPVAGHYEQRCNAHDTVRAGGGVWSELFDLSPLQSVVADGKTAPPSFRAWVRRGQGAFVQAIESVGQQEPVAPRADLDNASLGATAPAQ